MISYRRMLPVVPIPPVELVPLVDFGGSNAGEAPSTSLATISMHSPLALNGLKPGAPSSES